MHYKQLLLALAASATVDAAKRPADTSICDYYTKALLKENTAKNQATLLTLVVNTVVIGNYTMPNVGVKVPGILAPGKVDGMDVKLMGYFDGSMATTNRGGSKGVKVNFLDGGAAEPLKKNMPADDEKSNQYFLLTHLYQFFGSLLGCSEQGMPGFDAYTADPSMYDVHKFMGLNNAEMTYFIQQVGMAAQSFGVADEDVKAVGDSLNSIFNMRCSPPATAVKAQGEQLQAICIDKSCPLAEKPMCSAYEKAMDGNMTSSMPMSSETMMPSSTMGGGMESSMTMTGTGTMAPSEMPTAGAVNNGLGLAAVAAGIAAFAL